MADSSSPVPAHLFGQSNDLTRLSKEPGYLDYDAYRYYLNVNGHRTPSGTRSYARPLPQRSALQPNTGDRADNKTDFRVDQALWSQDDLPEILYIFTRPKNWIEKACLKEVKLKNYDIYGERLPDLPILPDHISSDVEGWRVEAWMRYDPRVLLSDIMDRMDPDYRPIKKTVIQMRTLRFRKGCKVLGWVAEGRLYDETKKRMLKEMISRGIDPKFNSTRGMSWGLIDRARGEAGGRVCFPPDRRVANTVVPPSTAASSASSSAPVAPSGGLLHINHSNYIYLNPVNAHSQPLTHDEQEIYTDAEVSNAVQQLESNNNITIRQTLPGQAIAQAWLAPPPSLVAPRPSSVLQVKRPLVVFYHNHPLTLKTSRERQRDAGFIASLKRVWFPYASRGRRIQLSYILDTTRLAHGANFFDFTGHWAPATSSPAAVSPFLAYARQPFSPADDEDTTEEFLRLHAANLARSSPPEHACVDAHILYH